MGIEEGFLEVGEKKKEEGGRNGEGGGGELFRVSQRAILAVGHQD